jgi:uncharacterized protein (DUF1697 family)
VKIQSYRWNILFHSEEPVSAITAKALKILLDKVPDDTQIWVFNDSTFQFHVVENVSHDKRSNSINLWINDAVST